MRICADNPLVSWEAVDLLVEEHLRKEADYSYNHIPRNNRWPDGLGAEICTAACPDALHRRATAPGAPRTSVQLPVGPSGRLQHSHLRPGNAGGQRPDLKLDLDTRDDYQTLMRCGFTPDTRIGEIIQNAEAVT